MKKLLIEGKRELSGTVHIGGAKNSIVALIPASILTRKKCVIENVPDISDVRILIDVIKYLGSKVEYKDEVLTIDNSDVELKPIPKEMASKLRASYYFMGSLLSRYHHVEIAYPGGCVIGSRPIDIHLEAFKKMGVDIKDVNGGYVMDATSLNGTNLFFNFPSCGATINAMLIATLAHGKTKIINAATEPEITNVASFLNSMGARIFGAGTSTIEINGVEELKDGYVKVIPDRIEAGTYLIMGSLLGKNLVIKDIIEEHLLALISKLNDAGVKLEVKDDSIIVNESSSLKALNIKTGVYPGFVTDLGQPMSVFLTQCDGESLFEETIYENRLRHVPHLNNMGANIKAFDTKAIIHGKTNLVGRKVKATDLRAGAAMLIAGMIADGETIIYNIEHLLRGYERIVDKLNNVGANIKLIDE